MKRPRHQRALSLLAMSLAAIISSCGQPDIKPDSQTPVQKSESRLSPKHQTEFSPQELLAQAQQKSSPEREALMLQAASIFAAQNKFERAKNAISGINSSQLPDAQFSDYSQISASIALQEGNPESARRILTNRRLEQQLKALDPTQEASLRELRAQAFERTGQFEEAVSERINLSAVLTSSQATNANQDALWKTLMSIPQTQLHALAAKGSGSITQGWYSLAALGKSTQDMQSQRAALANWQTQWRSHPAATNLPKELRILQGLASQQVKKIALLLPLQGRLAEAGEAVRDGFFAAYYHQLSEQHNLPNIRQYDTSKGAVAAYQLAVSDGADLVIGPLDREDVNQISKTPVLPVPVLSLNYPDQQPAQPVANLYQFGLAVEDEARQVARQAIQDGHKRAMIIAPALDSSERSAQAFMNEWQKLGGTLVGKSAFGSQDKFSENIRNLLLIDESQAREKLLQQQLGTQFEFTPRRRADVDMIFMAVTPAQGRQIKPTLVFHYADSIPVYATSSVYSGEQDPINNEDLSGVIFNTLPWIFDSNNPEKKAIAESTKTSAVYGRLHALGADAFHLHSRLPQLKEASQLRIYGATGSLQLLPDGRIEREQMWARFKAGVAEPLASIANGEDVDAGE